MEVKVSVFQLVYLHWNDFTSFSIYVVFDAYKLLLFEVVIDFFCLFSLLTFVTSFWVQLYH